MKKNIIYSVLMFLIPGLCFAQTKIVTPLPVSPVDSALYRMPDELLDWNPVAGVGPVTYDVQLSEDESFTSPVTFTNLMGSSVRMENLFFGKTYFWRVRAKDNTGISDWSEISRFTVFSKIILLKPSNNEENQHANVFLKWKRNVDPSAPSEYISGVDYIDCQVDTSYFWKFDNQITVSADLYDIFFLDEDNGWIVGDNASILYFNGNTWTVQDFPYSYMKLNAVYFVNTGKGMVACNDGYVGVYDGNIWTLKTGIPTDANLNDISVVNDVGWIVGDDGAILYFDDSGYYLQDNFYTSDLNGVYAVSENNVWAVGSSGTILHYDGTEWNWVASPTIKKLNDVFFVSEDEGWAVGRQSTILHYYDSTWTEYENNISISRIYSINMLNKDMGWIAGDNGKIAYYDGNTWNRYAIPSTKDFNSVFFLDTNNIWIAGEDGTVFSWSELGFSSPYVFTETVPVKDKKILLSKLLFGKDYCWRCRARHELDTSDWAFPWIFSTIDKVILSEPSNNSQNILLNTAINWNEIDGASTYIYEISRDPGFSFQNVSFTQENSTFITTLMFDSTYYWRVKAAHNKDTTEWSDIWSFTTINTVFLVSPENGDTACKLPVLTWEGQAGSKGYILEYDLSENFINAEQGVVMAPSSHYQVIYPLEAGKTYYWRVRAFSNNSDTTGWSEVRYFVTETEPGTEDIFANIPVSVFPNPVNDNLFIRINIVKNADFNINIFNILGEKLISGKYSFNQENNTTKINVENLDKDIYILQIEKESDCYTCKLVID